MCKLRIIPINIVLVDGTDTKQVRRNLFSGCGAKLERSQSVVSMETEGLHKSDTSHSKQKQKGWSSHTSGIQVYV